MGGGAIPPPTISMNSEKMNVLHLLVSGGIGGIEVLMKNYARYSAHRNIFVFTWGKGEISEDMVQEGIPVHILNAGKENIFTTLRKTRNICLNEKVDVVVSHNSAPLLKLALVYLKLTVPNIQVVAYAHANARDICDATRKKGLLIRMMIHRLGFFAADGIVAISESVKKSLQDYLHISHKKIRRIYNGTPINLRTCNDVRTDERVPLKLVYVGRLASEKGVQDVIRVLAGMKDVVPFAFMIAGEGPYREKLEALVETLHLDERVHFMGMCRDVPSLLAQSDVFVHLPRWEEGFGITVIEAMAAGVICVVNNRGALPEIVEDGVNGIVLPGTAPEMLQEVLVRLMHLPEDDWSAMQQKAVERAKNFSLEIFAEELDQYLLSICRK